MFRLLAVCLIVPVVAAADVPEPDGYRGEPYRAPVPSTLAGAEVVDTAQAHVLWQGGEAVFIDVLPRAPKPENLPEGTVWHQPARQSVPGAVWLPNVGYASLSNEDARYLRDGLARLTDGDATVPLVFFCLAECWMSWNAAKRALDYGYSAVHWYPDGTDGWSFDDLPTEPVEPMPGP